jgi:nucleoside-diphosphate-sugar epimerase
MSQLKIAIIGCGWLGLPLAKKLIKENFIVNGSTTSKEKISVLKTEKIEPFLIDLNKNLDKEILNSFLDNINVLIINIPPKIRKEQTINYYSKIQKITSDNLIKKINNIIFISSTSVYGSKQGKVSSQTIPLPDTVNGKEILKTEKLIENKNNTIIRFGGLINETRNPLNYLKKKPEVLNPDAPINYIHLEDCIGIIFSVIKNNKWGEIFLGVAPFHPTKKNYFDNLCEKKRIKKLKFSSSKTLINKEINDEKIHKDLNYKFEFPNL